MSDEIQSRALGVHDGTDGDPERVLLRTAVEATPDPWIVLAPLRDADGGIVDFVFAAANEAACEFNGLPHDRLVGTRLLTLHPAAAQRLLDLYREVVATGAPLDLSDWAYPQDLSGGQIRRYDVRVVRIGQDHLAQTWRDVTESFEERARAAAREQEYRLLAENAGDVVIRTRDGVALWVSASVEAALGWSAADLVGRDLTALVHPDDRDALAVARSQHASGSTSRLRYRVRTPSGTWRWVEAVSRTWIDDDGTADGTVGSLRIIDEEMAAREALEASQARTRGVIDSMLDPWVLLEAVRDEAGRIVDFRFVDANEAGCRANGLSREDLLGTRIGVLLPQLAESGMLARYTALVETGQPLILDEYPFVDAATGRLGFFDNRGVRVGDGLSLTWREVTDRRESAERVAASEKRYRLLAENASDVVVEVTAEGLVTWVSPSVSRLLGWDAEELAGTSPWALIHPEDRRAAAGVLRGEGVAGSGGSIEVRIQAADGSFHVMWAVGRPVQEPGVDQRFVVALRDVTELRRARDLQEQQRIRLQATLDSLLDPHVLLEAIRDGGGRIEDFRYLNVNPAACASMGLAAESMVGARLLDLLPGHVGTGLLDLYAAAVESGEPLVLDDYRYPHDLLEEERYYDIRAIKVGDGLSFTWRDVTERHDAAQRLAAAEQHYRLLAENASEVVLLTGQDGRLSWVSPSVEKVLGWRPEDLIGRRLPELIDPDHLAEVIALQRQIMADGGTSGQVRLRLRTADGGWRWMHDLGSLVRDDTGALVGGVDALRDVQTEVETRAALEESEERFRMALETSLIGMCLVNPDGSFLEVNPALCAMLGRDRQTLTRSTWQELTHPDDLDVDLGLVDDVLHGRRDSYQLLKRFLRPDRTVVWGELAVSSVRGGDGAVRYFVSQIVDVTETIAARAALAASEANFRLLAENAASVVLRVGNDDRPTWVSPSITAALGWQPSDLVGQPLNEFVHPDDRPHVAAEQERARHGHEVSFEARVRTREGDYRWFAVMLRPMHAEDGTVIGRVAGWRDINDEHRTRIELTRSEERFRTAMESAPVGMAVVDMHRRFVEVNPALCLTLGHDKDWLLEHGIADLLDTEEDATDLAMRAEIIGGPDRSRTWESRMVRADGRRIWVEHSVALLQDESGQPLSYVSQFVDVTVARRAREQLRFLATHDPLTELVNRRELVARVQDLLTRTPRRGGDEVGILFVDLDGLKAINDTHGHLVGDRVIQVVADRIQSRVRTDDLVARFGGDEYVVVLPALHNAHEAMSIAANIQHTTAEPIHLDGLTVRVTLSIGVSIAAPGDSPQTALSRADAALYRAKREGRARVVRYDPDLDGPQGTDDEGD